MPETPNGAESVLSLLNCLVEPVMINSRVIVTVCVCGLVSAVSQRSHTRIRNPLCRLKMYDVYAIPLRKRWQTIERQINHRPLSCACCHGNVQYDIYNVGWVGEHMGLTDYRDRMADISFPNVFSVISRRLGLFTETICREHNGTHHSSGCCLCVSDPFHVVSTERSTPAAQPHATPAHCGSSLLHGPGPKASIQQLQKTMW